MLILPGIIYSCLSPLMLGFAAIGLWLMYFAYRYNLLFVYTTQVDTLGLVYPRALKHLSVGLYIAEITLIGLFAVSEAIGPAILMVIFTIGSILFHLSLNSALGPLLQTLPRSLEVEEEHLMQREANTIRNETSRGMKSIKGHDGDLIQGTALPAPHKKPNMITKWLRPDKYSDYHTLRRLVPRDFVTIEYASEVEASAYYNPAVAAEAPTLWVPRDPMGVSRQEVAHTGKVIPISDEDASFDEKGKLFWDPNVRPPIYQEKVYY